MSAQSGFNALLQKYVNKSFSELVEIGTACFVKVFPYFKEHDPDTKGAAPMLFAVMSTVGMDNTITAKEQQFIEETLGLSPDDIKKNLNLCNDEVVVNTIDKFIDQAPEDIKSALVLFVICLCACDDTIKVEETDFIIKLLG